jgi:cytochrome c oxidase assembly factor CtaG
MTYNGVSKNCYHIGGKVMWSVIGLLALIIFLAVIADHYNTKRKIEKGICPTTGGGCTSPTGCSCDPTEHKH